MRSAHQQAETNSGQCQQGLIFASRDCDVAGHFRWEPTAIDNFPVTGHNLTPLVMMRKFSPNTESIQRWLPTGTFRPFLTLEKNALRGITSVITGVLITRLGNWRYGAR